jgi:glycerol-3-phosphate acyltransferase PlsY
VRAVGSVVAAVEVVLDHIKGLLTIVVGTFLNLVDVVLHGSPYIRESSTYS